METLQIIASGWTTGQSDFKICALWTKTCPLDVSLLSYMCKCEHEASFQMLLTKWLYADKVSDMQFLQIVHHATCLFRFVSVTLLLWRRWTGRTVGLRRNENTTEHGWALWGWRDSYEGMSSNKTSFWLQFGWCCWDACVSSVFVTKETATSTLRPVGSLIEVT